MSNHHIKSVRVRTLIVKLRERDGSDCWICDCYVDPDLSREHDEAGSLDHYIPVAQGGSNSFENLRLAHRICNRMRGNVNMTGEARGCPEDLRKSRYVRSSV